MTTSPLASLEASAYRQAWSDGIVDLFLGLSLIWMGVAWIWLPDVAAFAGLLPAVLAVPMLGLRTRVVEPRMGYVRWAPPRRQRQLRSLLAVAAFGLGLLAAVSIAVVVGGSWLADSSVALEAGLMAWLLALLALALFVVMQTRRMLAYAAVLTAGGVVAALADLDPGWPLLGSGIVVLVVAGGLLTRFLSASRGPQP